MNVITLLVFVSLMLVLGSLLAFGYSMRQRDHQEADRLALLPFNDEDERPEEHRP